MYIYVLPEAFVPPDVLRSLNPFDKLSGFVVAVSAADELGLRTKFIGLYGERAVSYINQSSTSLDLLIKINLGLKFVYTNGPSVEPLPV